MSSKDRSSSSSGHYADDEISIDEEEIFSLGDKVIVRKSRVNKDLLINNIYMFYGDVVGFEKCKPEKDKTYNDYKNSYCVKIIKYRTNKDNFKEDIDIPDGNDKLIWAHPNEIFKYYGDNLSSHSLRDASTMTKKDWHSDKELEAIQRAQEYEEDLKRKKESRDLLGQQMKELEGQEIYDGLLFTIDGGRRKRKRRRKRTKKRGRKTRKKKEK